MGRLRHAPEDLLPAFIRPWAQRRCNNRRRALGQIELYGDNRDIDESRLALLRDAPIETLRDPAALEAFLPTLGLNDEAPETWPSSLEPSLGQGLLFWQYPAQFAPYLVELSRRDVRNYLEIGTRHGGTFVLTVEYLRRFGAVDRATGVDLMPAPGLERYASTRPEIETHTLDSTGREFRRLVERIAPIDLALIDGDHAEDGCRQDFERLRPHARILAFHDIVNDLVPGVGTVWREVRDTMSDEYECLEFTAQYPEVREREGHSYLGIGLAIRRDGATP
ncbi:MAG: class I SAM-dependent methyltransferase [Solirubrobacteraceae bacterium]|nr:class I SAM-dependent methyltransferase [Solirubrobacteraceae bacterium]